MASKKFHRNNPWVMFSGEQFQSHWPLVCCSLFVRLCGLSLHVETWLNSNIWSPALGCPLCLLFFFCVSHFLVLMRSHLISAHFAFFFFCLCIVCLVQCLNLWWRFGTRKNYLTHSLIGPPACLCVVLSLWGFMEARYLCLFSWLVLCNALVVLFAGPCLALLSLRRVRDGMFCLSLSCHACAIRHTSLLSLSVLSVDYFLWLPRHFYLHTTWHLLLIISSFTYLFGPRRLSLTNHWINSDGAVGQAGLICCLHMR